MPGKFKTNLGSVSIDDNVVATIAGLSAMECYGIVGLASKNATDGFFEMVKWENLSKGVKIISQENEVNIDLHVILQYGVRISVVAGNIIEKVKYNVENLTGLKVGNINVYVQGINVQK